MTEAEWLTPGDLSAHIAFLRSKRFDRKPRLFGVACCGPFEPWMYDAVMKEALLRSESLADGLISSSTMQKWRQKLDRAERARWTKPGNRAHLADPERTAYYAVRFACREGGNSGFCNSWMSLVRNNSEMGADFGARGPALAHAILLEVFGNPFRPVAFAPEWRTDTVLALAKQMYEARDFGGMPILADALQDAGCDNEDVLAHCRGEGPHVRGCWVVDLVLGKE